MREEGLSNLVLTSDSVSMLLRAQYGEKANSTVPLHFSLGENLSGSFNTDLIQSDPTTEDPPPGFEDNRGNGKGERRSPRILKKSGGRYISAEDKARAVLGFDCILISPKCLKRKHIRQEEINLSYFYYDHLTSVQAEMLVNTAAAEFEGDLQSKISTIITVEGAMAAAKQAIV